MPNVTKNELHPRFISAVEKMFNVKIKEGDTDQISGKQYTSIAESLQNFARDFWDKDILDKLPKNLRKGNEVQLMKQNKVYDGPFNVIGISGKAGSGKSTIASMLEEDLTFAVIPMAEPLKALVAELFDIKDVGLLNDQDFKASVEPLSGKTYRYILQTVGTEWGRSSIDNDVWTKLNMLRIIDAYNHGYLGVVIPDVRFDNEAKHIKELSGKIFQVERSSLNSEDVSYTHASEAGIDKKYVDITIYNDKGIEDLKKTVMENIFKNKTKNFELAFGER